MTRSAARALSPVRRVLGGGSVVTVKTLSTVPAVTINASCRAGVVDEPADRPGLAHFVAQTVDRGTAHWSAEALADALDSRGVALQVTTNRHVLTVSTTCLAEDFEDILAIVVDVVRRPSFPPEEVERRRAEILTAIGQDEDMPAVQALEGLLALLYGAAHPYGRRLKGTAADVRRLDRAALEAFHRAHVTPAGFSLVVVGDVEAGRALDAAARLLEDWRGPAPSDPVIPPPPPAARRRWVRPMPNKAQADIAYGFTTVRRTDPEYYAYWVLNTVLGQYGLGGRLGEVIRERQGMAYYVFSSLDAALVDGPLVIRAGVDGSDVERAIAAIDAEVAALGREGVTAEELADTKRYLTGSLPRLLETTAGIATFLQTAEFFALGPDYDARLPGLLEAVTRDAVHAAAARLSPDRAAIAVAGPYVEAGAAGASSEAHGP
jgi:zinc protease